MLIVFFINQNKEAFVRQMEIYLSAVGNKLPVKYRIINAVIVLS